MTSAPVRSLLREMLTGADAGSQINNCDDNALREFAALASVVCGMLVSRMFATPDDVRIASFVDDLRQLDGLTSRVPPDVVDAVIRANLGDQAKLVSVPPDLLTVTQLVVSRAIVVQQAITPTELEHILALAEPLSLPAAQRVDADPGVVFSGAPAPRRSGARGQRAALAAATLVLVIFVVTALGVPGFLLSSAQTSQPASTQRISTSIVPPPTRTTPPAPSTVQRTSPMNRPAERISAEGMHVIRLLIASINAGNVDDMSTLFCESQRHMLHSQIVSLIPARPRLRVAPDPAESVPPSVTGRIVGTLYGNPIEGFVVATNLLGPEYCIMSFQLPG